MHDQLHTLTITTRESPIAYAGLWGSVRYDLDYESSITCTTTGCNGWQECREPHVVEGYDGPNDGPDDSEEDAPWADREEFEFHGVLHTWRGGWGWTVPFVGCVLAEQDLADYIHDIYAEHGPGEYLVDDDWWDETHSSISAVSMADGSPLPAGGWAQRNAKPTEEDQ